LRLSDLSSQLILCLFFFSINITPKIILYSVYHTKNKFTIITLCFLTTKATVYIVAAAFTLNIYYCNII